MICPNCGKEIPFSEVCSYCGSDTEFTSRAVHLSVGNRRNIHSRTVSKKPHRQWVPVLFMITLITGLLIGASVMHLIDRSAIRSQTVTAPTDPQAKHVDSIEETESPSVSVPVSITFDLNPTAEMAQHLNGVYPPPATEATSKLPSVRSVEEWTFFEWNTRPDGSGERFSCGEIPADRIAEDTTLYAQWIQASLASEGAQTAVRSQAADEITPEEAIDPESSADSTDSAGSKTSVPAEMNPIQETEKTSQNDKLT